MMSLAVQCTVWARVCGMVTFCGRATVASGAWDVVMPAFAALVCPWGYLSPQPYGPKPWGLAVFGGQVLWSFPHSAMEGGKGVATWGFGVIHVAAVVDVVSCRCADIDCESATKFWGYWEKKPTFDISRETCLSFGDVSERAEELMCCEKFLPELLSTGITFLTQKQETQSFERKDRSIYCMQIKNSA